MTHKEIKDKLIKVLFNLDVSVDASVTDKIIPIDVTYDDWGIKTAKELGFRNYEELAIDNHIFLGITDNGYIIGKTQGYEHLPYLGIFGKLFHSDKIEINIPNKIKDYVKFPDSSTLDEDFNSYLIKKSEPFWKTYNPENNIDNRNLVVIKAEDFFNTYLEEMAKVFGFEKFSDITEKLNEGININKIDKELEQYITPQYNYNQIFQIYKGLKSNVDTSKYADSRFNSEQMLQIRQGLELNLNTDLYADPEFNENQMRTLKRLLKEGKDVSLCLDTRLTSEEMHNIVICQDCGLDPSLLTADKFRGRQLYEMALGFRLNLTVEQVTLYAKPEYTGEQMHKIRHALKNHLELPSFAKQAAKSRPTIQEMMKSSSKENKSSKRPLKKEIKSQIKR